jgi:hypothetical protein
MPVAKARDGTKLFFIHKVGAGAAAFLRALHVGDILRGFFFIPAARSMGPVAERLGFAAAATAQRVRLAVSIVGFAFSPPVRQTVACAFYAIDFNGHFGADEIGPALKNFDFFAHIKPPVKASKFYLVF